MEEAPFLDLAPGDLDVTRILLEPHASREDPDLNLVIEETLYKLEHPWYWLPNVTGSLEVIVMSQRPIQVYSYPGPHRPWTRAMSRIIGNVMGSPFP